MTQETKLVIGVIVVSLSIVFGGVFFLSNSDDKEIQVVANGSLITKNSYKTEPTEGKITIVEFADFQCPACARTAPALERIVDEYEGKVSLVFRHFPLSQHKNAMVAAEAAEAAGSLGGPNAFWNMYTKLYATQATWEENDKPVEFFVTLAEELNLDNGQFKKSIEQKTFRDKIWSDYQEGLRIGVNGTPTLYINNKKMIDAPTYENLKARIDEELEK